MLACYDTLGAEEAFRTLAPVWYPSNLSAQRFHYSWYQRSAASGLFEDPQAML